MSCTPLDNNDDNIGDTTRSGDIRRGGDGIDLVTPIATIGTGGMPAVDDDNNDGCDDDTIGSLSGTLDGEVLVGWRCRVRWLDESSSL